MKKKGKKGKEYNKKKYDYFKGKNELEKENLKIIITMKIMITIKRKIKKKK